jgi:dTDP-4-amino-4,6-dideoxygalactose transaminase
LDGAVVTPKEPEGTKHAYHQYTVRTERREDMKSAFDENSIGYGVYYPLPIPDQPAYDIDESYPVAERASDEVISLPVHQNVSDADIRQIVDVALKTLSHD